MSEISWHPTSQQRNAGGNPIITFELLFAGSKTPSDPF
jgi:hypothetical protein